ncbi:MAG: S8 family peptidase [Chitinophagaceae bacterium]
MKLPSLFLVFLSALIIGFKVLEAAPAQYAFRVSFTDKKGSPALSATPSWLSAKSIARRANFGIALDSTDQLVSPLYIDSVLQLTDGIFHVSSRWLNDCVVLLTDSSKILNLQSKTWIRNIEWVGYFADGLHLKQTQGENPKSERRHTAKVTGSASYYGSSFPAVSLVNGDYLHDLGYTGAGKLIAVLDEGFFEANSDTGFHKMRTSGSLLNTYDFLNPNADIFYSGTHGLNCLSIMAGYLPGIYVGTAPDAQYALYATEDPNFTDALYELDNLIAGMERADSLGADVISASIVYNTFSSPYPSSFTHADLDGHSTNVSHAVNMAVAKGVFYTTSAGNEGTNSWNFLDAPADADSALTVGSVGSTKVASAISSPGPNSSGRVKPDVCLLGENVALFTGNNTIGAYNGTSFAAPQAAGYAACLMQAFPKATPFMIREAIIKSADHYTNPTAKIGYGVPDFKKVFQYLEVQMPKANELLVVTPNPFGNSLQLSIPANTKEAKFALNDVLGRTIPLIITQSNSTNYLLQVPTDLAPGFYFLNTILDGRKSVEKLKHE